MMLRRLYSNRLIDFTVLTLSVVAVVATSSRATAQPQKIFAIVHSDIPGYGNPQDTINFYDVTDVGSGGGSIFDTNSNGTSDPLFSVWTGFEIFAGDAGGGVPTGNEEDPSAITVNHANGTIYLAAFDSGTPGSGFPDFNPNSNPDAAGDQQGDFDLWRIDYQELLDDFVTNSRPKGTIYSPTFQYTTVNNELDLDDDGSPLFDGTADGRAHFIPHPDTLVTPPAGESARPTVFLENTITKVGEVARSQGSALGSFFDTELDFVDPETLLLLDVGTQDAPEGDFQIRAWNRVSTTPGLATINPNGPDGVAANDDDQQGGFNGHAEESWESQIVGRLEMDEMSATDPLGLAIVNRDGVLGVWAADADGGGDDISFFEIDLTGATPTLTKKELFSSSGGPFPTAFALDEDPSIATNTNDGDADFLAVDKDGNLVIGESGFFDTIEGMVDPPLGAGDETAEQPRVIILDIADYNGSDSDGSGVNEILTGGTGVDDPAAWFTSASVPAGGLEAGDDDVLNIQSIAYDRGTGYIYFIDRDDDFVEDIYVFDPATGTIVHSENDAIDVGFFNSSSALIFVRGDINDDGSVTAEDISLLTAAIADPTQGGKFSPEVGQEFYDLTGDGLLTMDDLLELQSIIGSSPGDFDVDGDVDGRDFLAWQRGESGDPLSLSDLMEWQDNYGPGGLAASSAVPEPSAVCLLGMALTGLALGSRRGARK